MDNEPEEVIKHQMEETRAALAEKLETLEQQVAGTVHNATTAVAETVECVKEAVQSTVDLAKTSVHDTVEAVKDTFDISRHVRQHPWLMVGGSVVVGFAGGTLLNRAERPSTMVSSFSTVGPRSQVERNGGVGSQAERAGGVARGAVEEPPSARAASAPASHRLLGDLGQKFEEEISKLKGLALGTVLGVVRDMITGSAPQQLSSDLADIIDSATVKLGGRPIHGPVLNMFQHEGAGQGDVQQRRSPAEKHQSEAVHCRVTGAEGTFD